MASIYQHFRPEEKPFIDAALDWKMNVEDTYASRLTDFLDPRQQFILQSVIGSDSEVRFLFYGGYEKAERKRALLYPEYLEPEDDDFEIGLYEIGYPKKFVSIEHPMVLGSLMSLGIKRDKYGDILSDGDRVQFMANKEIEPYLLSELKEIGKTAVSLRIASHEDIIRSREEWTEQLATVSSLRLDAVLSAGFSISRQKAQTLIERKLVKLNWKTEGQAAEECRQGDMISARGYGRCKVIDIGELTKKHKHKVTLGMLRR